MSTTASRETACPNERLRRVWKKHTLPVTVVDLTNVPPPLPAEPRIPQDDELLVAVKGLRFTYPALGRAKLLEILRSSNTWTISDKRLKICIEKHRLAPIDPSDTKAVRALEKAVKDIFPTFPLDPLKDQMRYNHRSSGQIKIYGLAGRIYLVTPVYDMTLSIRNDQREIADFLKVFKDRNIPKQRQEYLASRSYFKILWQMYWKAAELIDMNPGHTMTREIVRRQFMAEYRVDPRLSEIQDKHEAAKEEQTQAESYRRFKIEALLDMSEKMPDLVPLDKRGHPIWCEEAHGQFSMKIMILHADGKEGERLCPLGI